MTRPRISVFIARSVDGYIATDDDSFEWLTTVPVLLGTGKPLFHRIPTGTRLRLTDARAFPSGIVQQRYERG